MRTWRIRRADVALDDWLQQHWRDVGSFPLHRRTLTREQLQQLAYQEWAIRVTGDRTLGHFSAQSISVDRFDDGGSAELAPGQLPGWILG